MKKRALSGAAAIGLLLLGAAAWSQGPLAGDPVARQAAPSNFRDVLRGKVGQKCELHLQDGISTLSFPRPGGDTVGEEKAKQIQELRRLTNAIVEEVRNADDQDRVNQLKGAFATLAMSMRETPIASGQSMTLVAVGQDFVQLRDADGVELFVPLSRVDVVVRPAGK